jgi:pimeloyl-ACP methyl ester carboxylesterase
MFGGVFAEDYVDVDGLRIRYVHGGTGPSLVYLHGDGGLRLNRAHELLAEQYRLVAFEVPGFGESAAATLAAAARGLGLERFNLWGGIAALRLALGAPESIDALVLEAPDPLLPETKDQLAGLNVPTLVVFGTRDTVTPPETGRVYRAQMPNCNYVLVYDAGHSVGTDRPEAFSSLVGDFLERHEAFIVSQKSSLLNP